jgi:hypothetical protein
VTQIKEQCLAIQELLDPWIKQEGGIAFIASDFVHAWEILMDKPGAPRIAILFEDEKARVNFPGGDITGRVNRYFDVLISRGRSLSLDRSANLTTGVAGGRPLYDLAEEMRDKLRTVRFNPQYCEPPNYVGLSRWGKDDGFNMDAFKCSIWVGTQLPLPSTTPDNFQIDLG